MRGQPHSAATIVARTRQSLWFANHGPSRDTAAAASTLGYATSAGSSCPGGPGLVVEQTAGAQGAVAPGAVYVARHLFSLEDIRLFLHVTGDTNSIHSNHDAAVSSGFRAPVLPGMLAASLFPAIIGSRFEGAIYARQTLSFLAPVHVDDAVLAEVEVKRVRRVQQRFRVDFFTRLLAAEGRTLCVSGEATAIIPGRHVEAKG
eukprot:jgi/Tetstr1/449523/TSEL_036611.t1